MSHLELVALMVRDYDVAIRSSPVVSDGSCASTCRHGLRAHGRRWCAVRRAASRSARRPPCGISGSGGKPLGPPGTRPAARASPTRECPIVLTAGLRLVCRRFLTLPWTNADTYGDPPMTDQAMATLQQSVRGRVIQPG